ncbi:MAG: GlsB/YeaQ/YmgE family stress response membrane protein [Hyphomicrobiaceae bacterium]
MPASAEALIILLVVGAIAGFLAGTILKGRGFGVIGNIIVGVIGAFLGAWLLGVLGVSFGAGIVGSIISALIGAVVLLLVIGLVKRA